jgi:hypothetical protein
MFVVPAAAAPSVLDPLSLFSTPSGPASAAPPMPHRDLGVFARTASRAAPGDAHVLSAQPLQPASIGSSPGFSYESDLASRRVGQRAVPVGDVNGDGISDFVATGYVTDFTSALYLFLGSVSGPVLASGFPNTTIPSGPDVAPAGDVNGDGYDDVALFWFGSGSVYIYYGNSSGLDMSTHTTLGSLGLNQYGMNVAPAGDVNGDGFGDLLVGLPNSDGTSPCSSSPGSGVAWLFYGSGSGPNPNPANNWILAGCWWSGSFAGLGTSVCGVGDVNADGFDDIAVGTPGASISGTPYGKVYIVYGSGSGLPLVPGYTNFGSLAGSTAITGQHPFAAFGTTVAPAGDLNEDGYADIAIGAPSDDTYGTDSGEAYVFRGGSPADTAWADQLWWESSGIAFGKMGLTLTPAGDENGDGRPDLLVGEASRIDLAESSGATLLITQWLPFASTNSQVMTAGDVNGDGMSDVLVGDPSYTNGESTEGRVLVYYGAGSPPSGFANWSATQVAEDDPGLGWSVAPAGDVNGDGFDDVLVGAPTYFDWTTPGATNNGLVMLFLGHPGGPSTYYDWAMVGADNDALGYSVAASDLNGDGYSDVIVGAPTAAGDFGEVRIWYGSASGPSFGAPDVTLTGTNFRSRFGHCVAAAGDVNGDGYPDMLVGAPNDQDPVSPVTNEGRAYLYAGGGGGLVTTPLWSKSGGQANGHLGFSVAGAGDMDGNGFGDIVIGVPDADNFIGGNTVIDAGLVWFEFGGKAGIAAQRFFRSTQAGARFGYAVASAGDVNGDGGADVIVGGPNATSTYSNEGVVRVITGGAAGITTLWTQYGGEASGSFGASVSSAGDLDGDGLCDVIVGAPLQNMGGPSDQGRAYVYRGPLPAGGAPFWTASGNGLSYKLGQAVANAGDVNNDGWPDLLVGEPGYTDQFIRQGLCSVYLGSRGYGSYQSLEAYHATAPAHFIEPGCLTDADQLFIASMVRSAAGRAKVRLQYSVKPVMVDLPAPSLSGFTPFSGTGAPGTYGSTTAIFKIVSPLVGGLPYAWSVRTLAHNVWYPTGPWRGPVRNGRLEADVRTPGTWVDVPADRHVATLDLAGVRPNPMIASAAISFSLSRRGPVTLEILDIQGRRVRTLAHGTLEAGSHLVDWDGRGADGVPAGSGVYFVRMEAEGHSLSHRLVRVR